VKDTSVQTQIVSMQIYYALYIMIWEGV